MRHKFLLVVIMLLVIACPASASRRRERLDIMDSEDMSMARFLLAPIDLTGKFTLTEAPEYNLRMMKQINPDFMTYPEADGIIWKKHTITARSERGGIESVRLYVILGRRGLDSKWLNWNIPVPAEGTTRILEAKAYDFTTLAEISTPTPEEDSEAGIIRVNFQGLPDTFIIAIAWHEHLPSVLSVEGLNWFQESLRVWEAVTEVYSPETIAYRTFPDSVPPERDHSGIDMLYTWRRINLDPFIPAGEIARLHRAGVIFSTRRGTSGVLSIINDLQDTGKRSPDPETASAIKRSKSEGTLQLIERLMNHTELYLAEGSPRKIPASGPLTRTEKIFLAKSWLALHKIDASLNWQIPFEPDDMTPLCAAMFTEPVLDVQGVKGVNFHNMTDPKLLGGTKIYGITTDGKLSSRIIPAGKSTDNRLSAVMDLRLNEHGAVSGTVRLLLRGAWAALILTDNPSDDTAARALPSLFPDLTNYKDVKYRTVKGIPEISFTVDNKPGIGGTGNGVLAILPFFEPVAMRKLGGYDAPVELAFPFIVDQNITLGFPKNASEALISNKVSKNPDKINYSESYTNRRHRLIAEARFELNMNSVTSGNMSLLRRNLDMWRMFSARHIPVR